MPLLLIHRHPHHGSPALLRHSIQCGRYLLVVGEDQKMGGFAGEGLESEDSLLEQGLGGDQFEEVFGLGLSAEGPETLAGASRHDEEEERRHE